MCPAGVEPVRPRCGSLAAISHNETVTTPSAAIHDLQVHSQSKFDPASGATAAPAALSMNERRTMSEFLRSGALILMGMTIMAAGVLVVFYG